MKYIILLICFITPLYADTGWYIEAGISIHDVKTSEPEIKLPNPLGNFGIGYNYKFDNNSYIDLYYKHTSSIPYTENGYGLNQLGLQYRKYLK